MLTPFGVYVIYGKSKQNTTSGIRACYDLKLRTQYTLHCYISHGGPEHGYLFISTNN